MNTVNRGWLRKQVEAGKVTVISSYSFDDMTGQSRSCEERPTTMDPGDWKLRKEGTVYFRPDQFKTKSGCAYWNDEAKTSISLIVHSNLHFDLRINK